MSYLLLPWFSNNSGYSISFIGVGLIFSLGFLASHLQPRSLTTYQLKWWRKTLGFKEEALTFCELAGQTSSHAKFAWMGFELTAVKLLFNFCIV